MKTNLCLRALAFLSLSFSLFLSSGIEASPLVSTEDLVRIEREFQAALKREKLDVDRLYYIHLIAARELSAHGFKAKAREYFSKALAIPTGESKAEPAIELFHDSIRRNESAQARADLKTALQHVKDAETRNYLESLASGILDGKVNDNPLATGLYGHPMVWKHLAQLMGRRQYAEAIAMLDREALSEGNVYEKITYDVLAVLVNGKRSGPLLCEGALKKYPDAYSYSMKICALLVDFKNSGKKDSAKLKEVQAFFEREKIKQTELLTALGDLP